MSRKVFTKIKKVMTPSGLWDNGLYFVSNEKVSFPKEAFIKAIIEDYECKGVEARCIRITVDGCSWIVLAK